VIPAREFQPGGGANGRALANLAHLYLGNGFGTAYDASTIAILWFAGASAMAGLLNLVPRYLPRYGMAPAWALATRPLVLVLITSAAYAVTLSARRRQDRMMWAYALITLIFAATTVTTVANMVERPDGLKIAGCFIAAVLIVSLVSRVSRAYELRSTGVTFDRAASVFLRAAVPAGVVNIIANEPDERDQREYLEKWQEEREANRIPDDQPVVFLEVSVADASEFESDLEVRGEDRFGHQVLTVSSTAVANGIAAICLAVRDQFGLVAHAYFDWTEGSPLTHFLRFILWGSGEVAPVTREVLRRAGPAVPTCTSGDGPARRAYDTGPTLASSRAAGCPCWIHSWNAVRSASARSSLSNSDQSGRGISPFSAGSSSLMSPPSPTGPLST
jgi:hypothetical protein